MTYTTNLIICIAAASFAARPASAQCYDEIDRIIPSDITTGAHIATAVAMDGDYVAIGRTSDMGNTGSVYIYKKGTLDWEFQQKLFASDGVTHDRFGLGLAFDNGTLAVGAPNEGHSDAGVTNGPGAIYFFNFDGNMWTESQKLIPSDGVLNDPSYEERFGGTMAISGTKMIVGVAGDGTNGWRAGAAYLYDFDGSNWGNERKIFPNDIHRDLRFGSSVALSGPIAVVGAWNEGDEMFNKGGPRDGHGAAYTFFAGQQAQKLMPPELLRGLYYGWAVAMTNDVIAIGAPSADSSEFNLSGFVYLYKREGATYTLTQTLVPADAHPGNGFGRPLAMSTGTLIAGALLDDDQATNAGSVYVYRRAATTWIEEAELHPSVTDSRAAFGSTLDVLGPFAIIGAPNEDNFNGGNGAGAAYAFEVDCDRDGDGLYDEWETFGIDSNNDGTIDLDLPAMGADPDHKDLFVEVDSMSSFPFSSAAQTQCIQAFANAPVTNPDGVNGIKLHIMVDETQLPDQDFPNAFQDFDVVKTASYGTSAERSDANWPNIKAARQKSFRYCIFGRSYSGSASSGLAETPGDDLMVTLGMWATPGGTVNQQAGTFFHELGHTLNLEHGGLDRANYKPNYYSVMNYLWQYPVSNYASFWRLDYSRFQLDTLTEAKLDERTGIDGRPDPFFSQIQTLYNSSPDGQPPQRKWARVNASPVDFNGNGQIDVEPVARDINYLYQASDVPSPGQVLRGHNDWPNLWYPVRGHAHFTDGVHLDDQIPVEMTREIFEEHENTPGPPTECLADFNGDGTVDTLDFLAFLNAFNAGDPTADFNGDGTVDTLDFLAFLNAFNTGC